MNYRAKINEDIDMKEIFSYKKCDWYIKLERGFYISRDLRTMLNDIPRPIEYFYRSTMNSFAEFVWYTRQNVRHAIIVKWRYIFLRKGYYEVKWLIDFLNNFIK